MAEGSYCGDVVLRVQEVQEVQEVLVLEVQEVVGPAAFYLVA